MGQTFALLLIDLVGHALERIERRRVGEPRHGFVDPPLGLSPTLLRHEKIPLPLCLFDLVIQLAQRALELLHLRSLSSPGLVESASPFFVLLLPHQRLLRQVVPTLLHGQHGAVLPLTHLLVLGVERRTELPLIRDGHRHFPLGLRELVPHVQNDLVQHLLGIFRPGDEIVDVRLDDRRQLRKNAHGISPLLPNRCRQPQRDP